MGRQGETRPRKADTPSRTGIDVETMGNNGTQPETRGDGETRRGTMGDKWRQDLGKADTPSNTGRQGETRPRRADTSSKAEAPSNTGTHVGTQGETRPREGGHTIQHRHAAHISRETIGDNEKQDFRKVNQPTQAHMSGDNGRQLETMGDNGRQLETTGHKDRQEGRQ